eukprot:m.3735 g.3735  ORF g.3735 m.3735 type:complete len:72 (-) comp3019_c0_seq1:23-238(-)
MRQRQRQCVLYPTSDTETVSSPIFIDIFQSRGLAPATDTASEAVRLGTCNRTACACATVKHVLPLVACVFE